MVSCECSAEQQVSFVLEGWQLRANAQLNGKKGMERKRSAGSCSGGQGRQCSEDGQGAPCVGCRRWTRGWARAGRSTWPPPPTSRAPSARTRRTGRARGSASWQSASGARRLPSPAPACAPAPGSARSSRPCAHAATALT